MCVIWYFTLVFLEIVLLSVQEKILDTPYSKKRFWTHPIVLLGEGAQVKARFGLFEDSANLDAR